MDPALIIAAGGSLATAVLGFLGGRRAASGKVSTTDADSLWAEARKQREEDRRFYTERLAELTAQIGELSRELADVRFRELQKTEQVRHIERENSRLTSRVNELERELVQLRGARGTGAK